MKHLTLTILLLALTASLFAADHFPQTLTLRWFPGQHVDSNCGVTEQELNHAVHTLTRSLKHSGMDVQLGVITAASEPSNSSTGLWIDGVPLETWLHAEMAAGRTDADCPIFTADSESYARIPSRLIVKAGLMAAGQLAHSQPADAVPALASQRKSAPACCAAGGACCAK